MNTDTTAAVSQTRGGTLRTLASDRISSFFNTLTLVADILTYWMFIETRDNKKKPEYDIEELSNEWNSRLHDIKQHISDVKQTIKQVSCHLDAVHLRGKHFDKDCLKYVQPNHIANTSPAKSTAVHVVTAELTDLQDRFVHSFATDT